MAVFAGLPRLATLWLVTWDILITEGALFHDFAGSSSPLHPSALFRWGPFQAPFTADLSQIGIGPLAAHPGALRFVQLVALALLVLICSRPREIDSRPRTNVTVDG
ncbi:MAG: hypothetical protein ABI837_21520 [Acidobacteriota bacterium]